MLPSRLAFFLRILTFLFVDLLCLPWTATAQFNQPRLISLPIQEFVPNAFIVYGRAPTQQEAGIANGVQYRQTTETLLNLKTFFEFGGTLELLTTTLFFSKHDIVISEIMWGLDTGYPLNAIPIRSGSNSTIRTLVHISQLISFCFLPLSRIIRTGIPSNCQMVCKRACSTLSATYT